MLDQTKSVVDCFNYFFLKNLCNFLTQLIFVVIQFYELSDDQSLPIYKCIYLLLNTVKFILFVVVSELVDELLHFD